MLMVVSTLLTLLESLLPSLGVGAATSQLIDTIIAGLIQILPVVIKEAQDLVPAVQGIISALSNHGAVTSEQMATLLALNAQCDAQFEAAAAADSAAAP